MSKPQAPDFRNLFIAMLLSLGIILLWQHYYARPKLEAIRLAEKTQQEAEKAGIKIEKPAETPEQEAQSRKQIIETAQRVRINTPSLHGSIALTGARLDDLTLVKYRTSLAKDSPEEILLSPAGLRHAYFAQWGWSSTDPTLRVPDETSQWQADNLELTAAKPVTLRWDNGQGVVFVLTIAVDENYLFTIDQKVENNSGQTHNIVPYAFLNRSYQQPAQGNIYLHEGPLGVMEGALTEIDYSELKEDGDQSFDNAKGWLGITDKYWLTAMIPDGEQVFKANFTHYEPKTGGERYQVEYLGQAATVASGQSGQYKTRFFAGAKVLGLLDDYATKYNIPLFDRAVDLGVMYFITKPIFIALTTLYSMLGNFGLAILALTVFIKLLLYPLANKSYKSMNEMKRLQPEMLKIRERYLEDKVRMNQEIMGLYKREKVNPASGCLPILIQLPIFIALYKVLFVTIEMRHAPFYGWIHDLSMPDPTNIFTLFGYLPWDAPALLHIGIWPILMFITMVVQQKLNPAPTDPVQARMMNMMPYIFVFLFATAPAGLVIYWAWSNVLSIAQQLLITRDDRAQRKKGKA